MKWTEEHLRELKENYFYYIEHKDEAELIFKRKWNVIVSQASNLNIISIEKNKKCSMFLGCHIAERVLSHV